MGSGLEWGALVDTPQVEAVGSGVTGSFQREVTPLKGLQDYEAEHGVP